MAKCMTNAEVIGKFSDPNALKKVHMLWGGTKKTEKKKTYQRQLDSISSQ